MTPELLVKTIGLPDDTVAAVSSLEIPPEKEAELKAAYDRSQDDFAKEVNKLDDPHLWVLALYIKWGAESYDIWHAAGIPDKIYFDTFKDIVIWSERYKARTGKVGLMEWPWFIIHIGMKLFRLGRLQFEVVTLSEDTPLAPKGTELLSIHIPRGEPMTAENIKESLDLSKEFFPKYFGKSYDLYYCNSWLLAPQLEQMLSERSGIRDFRRYFDIFVEDNSWSQAEDYIFLKREDDPSLYPEDTTLQRNFKKFLQSGGKMGMGRGIFRY